MKNKITILLIGLLLISFTSALDCWSTAEQNTEIQLIQKCPSCTYINLTSISYPNGTIFLNEQMQQTGINFNYTLPDSSQVGKIMYGIIGDKNGASPPEEDTLCIEITITGKAIPIGFDGRFILLLFFISLIVMLVYFQRQVNFDKWYGSILNKYKNRNFFRTFVSSIGHFFMKNPFSLFYMIGLFIMLLIYDITRAYALTSAYYLMQVLVGIYLFGLLLLVLEVFGDIQEFFAKIMDDFKGLGWGLNNG